jgi:hypothetical protein
MESCAPSSDKIYAEYLGIEGGIEEDFSQNVVLD